MNSCLCLKLKNVIIWTSTFFERTDEHLSSRLLHHFFDIRIAKSFCWSFLLLYSRYHSFPFYYLYIGNLKKKQYASTHIKPKYYSTHPTKYVLFYRISILLLLELEFHAPAIHFPQHHILYFAVPIRADVHVYIFWYLHMLAGVEMLHSASQRKELHFSTELSKHAEILFTFEIQFFFRVVLEFLLKNENFWIILCFVSSYGIFWVFFGIYLEYFGNFWNFCVDFCAW